MFIPLPFRKCQFHFDGLMFSIHFYLFLCFFSSSFIKSPVSNSNDLCTWEILLKKNHQISNGFFSLCRLCRVWWRLCFYRSKKWNSMFIQMAQQCAPNRINQSIEIVLIEFYITWQYTIFHIDQFIPMAKTTIASMTNDDAAIYLNVHQKRSTFQIQQNIYINKLI